MSKFKKILITGGSGFLGRRIVEEVNRLGFEVLSPGSSKCNLLSYQSTSDYLNENRPDLIIHSAAFYGGLNINVEEPANLFNINTLMTANVFQAASQNGVKKIISVGSACAYPGNISGDMKEEDFWNGPMHDSVIGYGSSKKIQHIAQSAYYKQYGIEGNHLCLTNLYGENDVFTEYRSHVASALIKRFSDEKEAGNNYITNWGDGSPIREFIYVKDAAIAIAMFIDQEHDLDPVNIGTGVGTSILELAEMTAKFMKYTGILKWDKTKPNGIKRKVLDISRMKEKIPNFKPIDIEVGLQITIEWYQKNKVKADSRGWSLNAITKNT